MLTRGRTLIRKTSLLRKIEPIARRSSFANKDHLQPAHLAMNERRNDLEIVKGRAIACTIQPGSISSLRCQKSRMSHPGEDGSMRSDVFADHVLDVAASIFDFIWWSQTGSNRRPHACKARALPAELWPRNQKTNASRRLLSCISFKRKRTRSKWWAWEDLNFRPHAYQARALTN